VARGTRSKISDDTTCVFVRELELVLPTTTSWLGPKAACMLCTVAKERHCFVNLTFKYVHVSKKTVACSRVVSYVNIPILVSEIPYRLYDYP